MILNRPRHALLVLALASATLSPSCKKETPTPTGQQQAAILGAPADDLSQKVEALTGAHTRAVWSHHTGTGSPDPFCSGASHQLHGFDSRDGRGARVLIAKKSNYSRPLITPDGSRILFTRKIVTRPKENDPTKIFDMTIMASDWQGAEPRELAPGYALDVWQDPATGHHWVYAARDVPPTHRIAWAAKKLVRFRLDDPAISETLWDQTDISPDNTQLSADGTRASGQTPWPHGGQYIFAPGGGATFTPTVTGCWAGMAPDNSYLSWMLDGSHRRATLSLTVPEKKTWPLKFNEIAGLGKGEIYHPRWSNHARFITLTGPYIAERGGGGDTSVIGKGGRTAEVVIAKLNDTATGFDGSVTLTKNDTTDAYPDVWIAGGDTAILSAYPQSPAAATATTQTWPANTAHLAFLWEALGQPNQIRLPDGKNLECHIEPEGAAQFGSRLDMQLATGTFKPSALAQAHLAKTLLQAEAWTLEAALLPPALPVQAPLTGPLLRLPGCQIEFAAGKLQINGATLDHPPLQLPAHLALRHRNGEWTLFLNGQPLPPVAIPPLPETASQFGGGLAAGLQGIALHTTALDDDTIQSSHQYWQARLAETLQKSPPRVRLRAKLTEATGVPTAEGIDPYTRAMITYVYDVEQVLEGSYEEKQILVCHWAMMDLKPCAGFPRQPGDTVELLVEPFDIDTHHPELKGQRVLDDTTAFDLEKWYDITPPALSE